MPWDESVGHCELKKESSILTVGVGAGWGARSRLKPFQIFELCVFVDSQSKDPSLSRNLQNFMLLLKT